MPLCSHVRPDRKPERISVEYSTFTWTGRAAPFGGDNVDPIFVTVDDVPEAYGDVRFTLVANADVDGFWKGLNLQVAGELEFIELGRYFLTGRVVGCTPSVDNLQFDLATTVFNRDILPASQIPGRITFAFFPVGNPDIDACGGNPWIDITMEFVYQSGYTTEEIDLKLWGEDWCQNAVFIPALRPREHRDAPPQGRILTPHLGYFELFSAHMGRWTTGHDPPGSFDEEPCKYSYATIVIDELNYGHGLFCSEQALGFYGTQSHKAIPFIHQPRSGLGMDDRLSDVIPKGYGGYIGAYQATGWSEVIMHSFQELCVGVEE